MAATRPIPKSATKRAGPPKERRNLILKPFVWLCGLSPLGWLIYGAFTGGLGANPIERITHVTGLTALTLVFAVLAITPLRRASGALWLVQYRRLVGLFAFFYACLHLLIYLVLDQSFSIPSMMADIAKRPFITMGALAWLCLLPLALTSTQKSMRRLGRNWTRLHRLIYVAAVAGAIHFYWLVKLDKLVPTRYLIVLAILFAVRIPFWLAKARAGKAPRQGNGITAAPASGAEMLAD